MFQSRNQRSAGQANIVVVGAAVAFSFLCGNNAVPALAQETSADVSAIVKSATPDLFISDDLGTSIRFQVLLSQWHAERNAATWVSDMVACPAYQKIIGLGTPAIPMILRQMESEGNEPDYWFWALRALADTDPVKEEDRGDIVRMAATWIEWGRLQGYAW